MSTEAKEVKLTVEKTTDKTKSKRENFDKEIKSLEKEITELKTRLEKSGYIVEGGSARATKMVDFLETRAQWKFNEAVGVIEATRQIKEAATLIEKGKTKELLLPNLCLEAVYYFISKVEGKGLEEARYYTDELLKPVADGLARSKKDKDAIDDKQFKLASYQNGIDPTKEIKAEDIEKI